MKRSARVARSAQGERLDEILMPKANKTFVQNMEMISKGEM